MADLIELRELAEKATPGPWCRCADHSLAPPDPVWHVAVDDDNDSGFCQAIPATPDDVAYIAAADPTTILALLSVRDAAHETHLWLEENFKGTDVEVELGAALDEAAGKKEER